MLIMTRTSERFRETSRSAAPRSPRFNHHGSTCHPRACFKIRRGPVFAEKALWRGEMSEQTRQRSVSEEQRSQRAFSAKTLRAAGLLHGAFVGSALTARGGDGLPKANKSGAQQERSLREMLSRASPPRPRAKSLTAGPRLILKQALRLKFRARGKGRFARYTSLDAGARSTWHV